MTHRKPRFVRYFVLGFVAGTAGLIGTQVAHADQPMPALIAAVAR